MAVLLTIGEVSRRTGVAQTTLRVLRTDRVATRPGSCGWRGVAISSRACCGFEVIRACKAAGFTLDEISALMGDHAPGKPVARALAEAKLSEIDAQMATLVRAKKIIQWGMSCECRTIDDCTCGIHHTLLA